MTVARAGNTAPRTQAPPEYRIGRYRIRARLGKGGMGVVYLGHDDALDRDVAVKTLRGEGAEDEERRGRFAIEARAAARLQHPNIVTVFELGEDRGLPFIAMELLGGDDLETLLRAGQRLTLVERLEIAIQTLRGLEFAHAHRIVHRDMKPSNIRVLDDGSVKILDFGIAKVETTSVTRAGMVVGTPHYMSPEHIRSGALDGRSDVFAVGVILHELFAARRPFSAEDAARTMFRIVSEPHPRLPPEAAGFLTADVQGVIDRALEKDADARYPSAAAMADALARIRERVPATLLPPDDAATLARAQRARREAADAETESTLERIARLHPESPEAQRAWRRFRRQPADMVAMAETARFPELDESFGRASSPAAETVVSGATIQGNAATVTGLAPGPAPAPADSSGMPKALLYGAVLLAIVTGAIAAFLYATRSADEPARVTRAAGEATASSSPQSASSVATATASSRSRTAAPKPGAARPGPSAATALNPAPPTLERPSTSPAAPVVAPAAEATLQVESGYPVTVTVAGRVIQGEGSPARFRVPSGTHEVVIESATVFLKQRETLRLDPETTATIQTPGAGKFSVRASPDNCKVFVDGIFADYPPILDRPIAAGAHVVSFEWPDGVRSEQTIQIQAGRPAYVQGRRP